MNVLPDSLIERIQFCESHLSVWLADPSAIGLTLAQVNDLADATAVARKSYDESEAARQASRAATVAMRNDVSKMHTHAANLVRQIKAFAQLQAAPATVYADSQIPEPSRPTPSRAPGKPVELSTRLNSDGSIAISWSAINSAAGTGAFFKIARKLPGQTHFVAINSLPGSSTQARRITCVDTTIPASAAATGAAYIVQGFRGHHAGEPSEAIVVQFGSSGIGSDFGAGNALKVAA